METGVGAKPARASARLADCGSRTKWAMWSRKISSRMGSWRSTAGLAPGMGHSFHRCPSEALLREAVEQRPIDLVARRERQFVDEPDETGMRVGGCIGQREALDLVNARAASGFRHHEGDRLLPLDLVVDRNDGGLRDVGMALEHALDVGRINVLATRDEHVVAAADEIMEAVGVAPEDIAGDVESVRGERRLHVRP